MPARSDSLPTPLNNPVIWAVTSWARKASPKLQNVGHAYCAEADAIHEKAKRVFAHSFCDPDTPDLICWAKAVERLSPNTVAGICLHEMGHVLAGNVSNEGLAEKLADLAIQDLLDPLELELHYRGPRLLQWVDFGKFLRRVKNA